MQFPERELRLYRRLLLFVGAIYLLWWLAVRSILPHAFNPLASRLAVVFSIWGAAGATHLSAAARRHVRPLFFAGLWLLTAHYFYLSYNNTFDINWIVGAFITVSAVSLALLSRPALIAYSIFVGALSIAAFLSLPPLRESVFLPGIFTVLLQANIGMQSRLNVLKHLETSNRRFRLLFDSTFEGILIHEEGRIVQANEAAIDLLGFPTTEIIDRPVLDFVNADDRAKLGKDLVAAAPQHIRGVRKDGSSIDLEVRGKPFSNGQAPEQLLTLQDVSERLRQAAALKSSNEALERSNIELQRFAFVASHDLQTPLRSIGSFIGLLQSSYAEKLDAQGNDWLGRTQQSAKQLQTLIQDLLDYSRLETNARPFANVAMAEVLERTRMLLDAVISDSNAEITHGDLPVVNGDRSQLVQLMLNLLGNAIKYRGADPPRIHLSAQSDDGAWRFAVKDNGIGIAPRHQQQIFEIFKRLHDAKEYPGTGIGLAVCRRVVSRHGGRIWVDSEAGQGSTFYFTLPKESQT
jgi:PAS domain S-box-containing protein